MSNPSLYKAGFLSIDFSQAERIWVYARLAQVFLSGVLVIKTLLHFMCGWSPAVYPIIITNGIILIYTCLSLHLHRRRILIRQFGFWSIVGHLDLTGMVGCIITAWASSRADPLRRALCNNRWGYCSNRGFHVAWMSFLWISLSLSTVLCFWLHFAGDEGHITLPDSEDSLPCQPVRSSSIVALAVAVPGTRSMNPDTVIQGAINYINSLHRAAGTSGEPGSSSTGIPVPDLSAQLSAMMARIEAIERRDNGKE